MNTSIEPLLPADAPARRTPLPPVLVRELGRTDYEPCWRRMQAFTASRDATTPDEIWLTEHAPVYTLGLAGRREHLHAPGDIPVVQVDRGGQVTYHGPGQVVAYLMVDIRRRSLAVRAMVRAIECAVIDLMNGWGIAAHGKVDAPGVYVAHGAAEAKLAALGLKVRNGCTYHGVALNIDMDLAPFEAIDPCGYPGLAVTSVARLGVDVDPGAAGLALASRLIGALAASSSSP